MLFNSLQFLIFFPLIVAFYFSLPHWFRWILLLVASYYFYMCWKAEYLILIVVSTLIDYYAGVMMGKTGDKRKRKKYLILSLFSNLGLLFAFKYFNFFNESARALFNHLNIFYNVPAFNVLLPVGISFYTFQTMSYSIDVYRGDKEPERNLGIFALYVAFFPQLVAGPIERSTRLMPQFFEKKKFEYQRVCDGLKLMLWGFFKKVVIADRLAVFVNQVYSAPTEYTGMPLLVATYFFAFQIYCDFSGYSDIAIGSAQVLGYDLMDNFNRPYFSKSIAEFWKRWHISLSSWFRDYLYIPLGGNRVAKWRWYVNLITVFLVSGLWHGASWTFVVWGGLHGFYLMFSIVTEKARKAVARFFFIDTVPELQAFLKMFITFHLVLFAWMFFRANSLSDALYICTHWLPACSIQGLKAYCDTWFSYWGSWGYLMKSEFLLSIFCILFMEFIHLIQRHESIRHMLAQRPRWYRWAIYYGIIVLILIFGEFTKQQFIYFQF